MSKAPVSMDDPDFDPYEILNLTAGASHQPPSDADIVKAYRKLALQLHPDKQQNDASPQEQENIAHRFHAIQEARAFLLEPEHADARRAFDTKRASQRLRRQQEVVREATMSERRKRMRDELKRKEQAHSESNKQDKEAALLEKLRKEGKDLAETHFTRKEKQQARTRSRQEKKERAALEERQVRAKWSRKRIKVSPSEHSLAQLFSKFGRVQSVEILGSKGNAALVTFESADSCHPCVQAYEASEDMRTSFVGKRRDEYEEEVYQRAPTPLSRTARSQDREGIDERRHRQAAERDRLARKMELEDADDAVVKEHKKETTRPDKSRPFPLEFDHDMDSSLSPLQKLEQYERALFKDTLSPQEIQQMQVEPIDVSP